MTIEDYNFILQQYQGAVSGLIYRMIHSREEARDLAQDAFIRLWKNCDKLDNQRAALDVQTVAPALIQNEDGRFRIYRTRSFYAAAAVLILVIFISLFILITNQSSRLNSGQNQTFYQGKTSTIPYGISGTGYKDNMTTGQISAILDRQTVPVHFLEQHLLALQNNGIDSFNISQVLNITSLKKSSGFEEIGNKFIPVSDCLAKLKTLRKYKSQLSFSELVVFVNNITEGGV